jgi:hypothetical protein
MRLTFGCRGIGQGFGLNGMQMMSYVTAILNNKLRHFEKVCENASRLAV